MLYLRCFLRDVTLTLRWILKEKTNLQKKQVFFRKMSSLLRRTRFLWFNPLGHPWNARKKCFFFSKSIHSDTFNCLDNKKAISDVLHLVWIYQQCIKRLTVFTAILFPTCKIINNTQAIYHFMKNIYNLSCIFIDA